MRRFKEPPRGRRGGPCSAPIGPFAQGGLDESLGLRLQLVLGI